MKYNVKRERNRPWKGHSFATCSVCGWSVDDTANAHKHAISHVRETGHRVSVQFGYFQQYYAEDTE